MPGDNPELLQLFSAYAEVVPPLDVLAMLPSPLLRVCGGSSGVQVGGVRVFVSSPRMRR